MSVYEPAGHVRAHEIRAEVVLDLPEGRAVVAGTIRVLADGLPYAGADLARASGQTLDAIRSDPRRHPALARTARREP